jgi:hypothetical protein
MEIYEKICREEFSESQSLYGGDFVGGAVLWRDGIVPDE